MLSHHSLCWVTSQRCNASVDPESFIREGPTLTTFFRERASIYHYKRGNQPFAGGSMMAQHWILWFFGEPGPVLLRNPIFLGFFIGGRGGGRNPRPQSGSAHVINFTYNGRVADSTRFSYGHAHEFWYVSLRWTENAHTSLRIRAFSSEKSFSLAKSMEAEEGSNQTLDF